jgi:hypothetical protein
MNHLIGKLFDVDYTALPTPAAPRIDDPVNELIARSRWIELAGLDKVPPGPAELQEDLQAKVITHLWKVSLDDGRTMHVVSSDSDLSSLEKSVHAWHGDAVMITSVTRIGEVNGTATLNDDDITAKLLRLQVLEEEHARLKRSPNERDYIIPSASSLSRDAEMIAAACAENTMISVDNADTTVESPMASTIAATDGGNSCMGHDSAS